MTDLVDYCSPDRHFWYQQYVYLSHCFCVTGKGLEDYALKGIDQ